MVAISPKRLMSFFLVAVLLKAVGASGGSLPASLSESHSPSAAAERSVPRRAGAPPLTSQANLGLDLGKLGRRVTEGSVYDMFSGAPKPESASSGPSGQDQAPSKKQRAARRPSNSKTPPPPPISPVAVPASVTKPLRNPPRNVLAMIRAMLGPGVTAITTQAAIKARRSGEITA